MSEAVLNFLRENPIAAVFLTLALGNLIGERRIGGLQLGSVTGSLLMGVLIGMAGIPISGEHKVFFLLLFLFATGYAVGPQFIAGLRKDGARLALFSFILCLSGVMVAYGIAVWMGWDAGTGAGLLAGGSTSSLLIGIAGDTIRDAGLSEEQALRYNGHVAMAYAVTYLFGAAGTSYFLVTIGFRLLDRDVAARCREYERTLGATAGDSGGHSAFQNWGIRAYRIEQMPAGVATIQAFEEALLREDIPVRVMRVRSGDAVHEATPDHRLHVGDTVALSMPLRVVTAMPGRVGTESVDQELLDFEVAVQQVVVTAPDLVGRPLGELRDLPDLKGVGVRSIRRGNLAMPIGPGYVLRRNDVVEVVGTRETVEVALARAGHVAASSSQTDVPFVALAIFLGLVAGALQLVIGRVPITLGMGGGVLVLGLVAGWAHARYPRIGAVPPASVWLLQRLGLDLFIVIVGLTSSAGFLIGLKELGLQLFLAGVAVSILPALLGILLGRYVFRFHPAITLGATCGSRTEAAALAVVQGALKSQTPALGFTVPLPWPTSCWPPSPSSW